MVERGAEGMKSIRRNTIGIWRRRIAGTTLLFFAIGVVAQAQEPDDFPYATGGLPASDEEIAMAPRIPLTRNFLPELRDLSDRFPSVGSQGRLGSCTSWAVGYAARSYYSGLSTGGQYSRSNIPSPAYMHGIIRSPEPERGQCAGGASIRDALILLQSEGVSSMQDMPYSDRSCAPPSTELRAMTRQSKPFSIDNFVMIYKREEDSREAFLDKIKTELANGHPVITSVQTDRAFHRLRGRTVWHRSEPINRYERGWHAITLVGYSEKGQYFKFINSWDTRWGDRGFGRLSYQTVLDHGQISYAMRVPEATPPRPEPEPTPPDPPNVVKIELPAVSCGNLSQDEVGGRHTITGFVREEDDLAKLKEAVGTRDVDVDVALRPWPQCEALMTLEEPLADDGQPSIQLPETAYAEGDTLSFSVNTGAFEGYVHVAYVQADGNVVNLVQQGAANLQTLGRGTELKFGDGEEGRAKFVVSEPYGKEMVIAISSASPLFDEPRPTVEVERTFLTALRKAILARPNPNLPERRISATYAVLETKGE